MLKTTKGDGMSVRVRATAGTLGVLLFVVVGRGYESDFYASWWFFVGLGMAISAVFLEPHVSRPQDAIFNGVGALAAAASAPDGPSILWAAYVSAAVLALLSGLLASLLADESALKVLAYRLGVTLGRAVRLGGAALLLAGISDLENDGEFLVLATAILAISVTAQWQDLVGIVGRPSNRATVVSALGPRAILLEVDTFRLENGDRMCFGEPDSETLGTVISRMPGKAAPRYQVALNVDSEQVASRFPTQAKIERVSRDDRLLGIVGQGSTATRVCFEPVGNLSVGDPVQVRTVDGDLLYQVAELELRRSSWDGSSALTPHATALQVGKPRDGRIDAFPSLPAAHEVVGPAADRAMPVSDGFTALGVLSGTKIEVGLDLRTGQRGHLAIVGMSGMGKTSVAHRVCSAIARSSFMLALDVTGEYASRLNIDRWDEDSWTDGLWLLEPQGDPPVKARELIEKAMRQAHGEYETGTPKRRVILLEEAHGFVPEWNFATRPQQDAVNMSARFVMQARKFELSFVVVSQRTAVVSKSVLTQCENFVVLRTIDETGLGFLEGVLGETARRVVPNLSRYQAVCVGPAFNASSPVIVDLYPPESAS